MYFLRSYRGTVRKSRSRTGFLGPQLLGILCPPRNESASMNRSPSWQWSLQSMFGLISASAVMALWLRQRLTIDSEWTQGRWISMPEGLALGCLAVWFAQCFLSFKYFRISPWETPRCELPAAAILFSGLDTVRNILNGYRFISCHSSAERLKKILEDIANTNAVLGYSFVFSCMLAMVIAMPRARESVKRLWFRGPQDTSHLADLLQVSPAAVRYRLNQLGLTEQPRRCAPASPRASRSVMIGARR